MDRATTCCFTGHRPDKLPWGSRESDPRCLTLKRRLTQAVEGAYAQGMRHFICGMARGTDLYFAEAVLALRLCRSGVTLEAAAPARVRPTPGLRQNSTGIRPFWTSATSRLWSSTAMTASVCSGGTAIWWTALPWCCRSMTACPRAEPPRPWPTPCVRVSPSKSSTQNKETDMKTLMHICCAPCANRPIAALREEGIELAGFWYNPNIHPYTEYRSRKTCLEDYAREISLPLVVVNDYGLRQFVQHVADNIDGRCAYCYRVRMEETARYAAEHGFDSFTTSLLISPYQNHEAICAVARAMGGEYGVEFLYRDFRPLFREGQQFARDHGFYMQKYCGCVFSEEDRYLAKKRKKEAERLAAARQNGPD